MTTCMVDYVDNLLKAHSVLYLRIHPRKSYSANVQTLCRSPRRAHMYLLTPIMSDLNHLTLSYLIIIPTTYTLPYFAVDWPTIDHTSHC